MIQNKINISYLEQNLHTHSC